jgi:hypothetical protein
MIRAMLRARLSDFSIAGWALIVLSLGACVAVAVPLGARIYADVDHAYFRENREWLCVVSALPGLAASVVVFLTGSRVLGRYGVRILRDGRPAAPATKVPLDVRSLVRDDASGDA